MIAKCPEKTGQINPVITKPRGLVAKHKKLPNKMHQISPKWQTGCPEKDIILLKKIDFRV